MRITLIAIAAACAACMTIPPADESAEQSLCNVNPDSCPGWPVTSAKAKTRSFTTAVEAANGLPTPTPQASCDHQVAPMACTVHAPIGVQWVETTCNFYLNGSYLCFGRLCREPTSDECAWVCDPDGGCSTQCPDQVCEEIGHDEG